MQFTPKANPGRIGCLLAALGTLCADLAISAAPFGAWSTAFLLIAPALPAAVLWRAVDPVARLVLAGAAAVVVDAVVAEVMLATASWSPPDGRTAVAVISALMWLANAVAWNAMARQRSRPCVVVKLDAPRPTQGSRRSRPHRSSREQPS